MKNRRGVWVVVALAVTAVGPSRSEAIAQEATGEPRPGDTQATTRVLTMDRAMELAVSHSPLYRKALNQLEMVGPQGRQAWGGFLPSLSVSYGTGQRFDRQTTAVDFFGNPIENPTSETIYTSSASQGLSLGLDLFQGGRRFHQLGEARAVAEANRRRGQGELNGVLAQVQRQFLGAQEQAALLTVERELLVARERDLEVTRRLFDLANKNRADVLGIEVELEQQRSGVRRAEGEYRKALLALQTAIGDPGIREMAIGGREPETFDPEGLNLAELVAQAVQSSPRVLEAGASSRSLGAQLAMSRSDRWPTISLNGNVGRGSYGPDQSALFDFSPSDIGGSVQLSVSIPVFQRFNTSYQIAQASVAHQNALEDQRLMELQVEEEVRARYVDLETAWLTLQDAGRSLALAQERLRLLREEYRLATATFEDLQGAVRTAAEGRRAVVQQRYAFARALVDLYEAAGVVAERAGLANVAGAPDSEN